MAGYDFDFFPGRTDDGISSGFNFCEPQYRRGALMLSGKKILVGVTGGIAAYKTPFLVRQLVESKAAVRVVMTEAARHFVTPLVLETLSGNPVSSELFPKEFAATHHIELARWPDLIVVAPATADFIGRVASGLAPD